MIGLPRLNSDCPTLTHNGGLGTIISCPKVRLRGKMAGGYSGLQMYVSSVTNSC